MAYTPTQWVNGKPPALNAENLNKLEAGIQNNDAEINSINADLGELKSDLVNLQNGNGKYDTNLFTRGSLNDDGSLNEIHTFRVSSVDYQHNDIKRKLLSVKSGFRFGVATLKNGDYKWSGWINYGNSFILEADTDFKLQIARVDESGSEIADINLFVGCISIKDVFGIETVKKEVLKNTNRITIIESDVYEKSYVLMDNITTESGFVNINGITSVGGDRAEIDVLSGEKYTFSVNTGNNARIYVLLDSTTRSVLDYYQTQDDWNTVHNFDVEYTVPYDGILVVNTVGRASELQVKKWSNKSKLDGVYKSVLYGKKLSVNGDSICAGAGYVGGYAKIIGEMFNMSIQNIGVGGGTITPSTDRHCISNTISNMTTDADFYLLEGGVNDSSLNLPLGNITPRYDSTLDTTTFYGAFENMLKQAVIRFEGKKLGYIAVHQMTPNYRVVNDKDTSYYWASKICCEKWGIPFLDLNANCPPLGYFDYEPLLPLKQKYTNNGDGWHPNEDGYKKYYVPKIVAFLESL